MKRCSSAVIRTASAVCEPPLSVCGSPRKGQRARVTAKSAVRRMAPPEFNCNLLDPDQGPGVARVQQLLVVYCRPIADFPLARTAREGSVCKRTGMHIDLPRTVWY